MSNKNTFIFERDEAVRVLEALDKKRFEILEGLSKDEIQTIEERNKISFPEDYRTLLMTGVLTDPELRFPNWRMNNKHVMEDGLDFIKTRFKFDIEENNYWSDVFGPKPSDTNEAVQVVLNKIGQWPALISGVRPQIHPVVSWSARQSHYFLLDAVRYHLLRE